MLKKIENAAPARCEQRETLRDLESSIPPDILNGWREAVETWEYDSSAGNPYKSNSNGMLCQTL